MPKSQHPLIYELPSIVSPLDLGLLFPVAQPIEVELGCGDSSFLVKYAEGHRTNNFIGVERLLGRIQKLDRKARREGLTNVRGIRIESSYFLQYLLPPNSVVALHIYFPDPWPKRKHVRHRLLNDQFPALAQGVLATGGKVFLRTDDANYYSQMLAVFGGTSMFGSIETPAELAELRTDFEMEFNARGIPTQYAAYELLK